MRLVGNSVSTRQHLIRAIRAARFLRLHRKYHEFTMASASYFWRNMLLVDEWRHVSGCVVECGVWRGGMSAGMAEVLGPDREYFLFDSFEGLPPAETIDGKTAKDWQADTQSTTYYDNCRASIEFAERAMKLSGVPYYHIIKGWFIKTLPEFVPPCPIAVLRLDGDWYDSTMVVLVSLYKYLAPGALIVVDDYYAWDGCSRAIHDFLSQSKSVTRVTQKYGVCILDARSPIHA